MRKINTLEELLIHELQDLYDAEQHIVKALPKMAKAASSPHLRAAFEEHLNASRIHVSRLEQVFSALGQTVKGETCKGIKGLLDEGEHLIDERADPMVKDAGLIVAAQKVEHYEIVAYASLKTWALTLGHERVADLLQRTLEEEKETDHKLTELAESSINVQAQHVMQ